MTCVELDTAFVFSLTGPLEEKFPARHSQLIRVRPVEATFAPRQEIRFSKSLRESVGEFNASVYISKGP